MALEAFYRDGRCNVASCLDIRMLPGFFLMRDKYARPMCCAKRARYPSDGAEGTVRPYHSFQNRDHLSPDLEYVDGGDLGWDVFDQPFTSRDSSCYRLMAIFTAPDVGGTFLHVSQLSFGSTLLSYATTRG